MRNSQVTTTVAMAILCFVWLLLAVVAVSNIPQKKMANTVVRVVPSKEIVLPNENFTVDINIEPAAGVNVAGWQMDLNFNPKAVKVNSVSEGNILKQGGNSTYFMPGTIDNTDGVVKAMVGVTEGPGSNVTTAGTAVTLQCTALATGQTSAFALANVIVANMQAVALPLDLITAEQVAVTSLADLNSDGKVDAADMTIVAEAFGLSGNPGWRPEDLNKDGVINVLDMILVGQNFT